MNIPLQVSYRNLEPSPAIEAAIKTWAERLEQVYPHLSGCRVMVETPHRRHRTGTRFHVRIDMTVPGAELVVGRDTENEGHTDFYVALRDAFRAARRQLEDYARKRRGQTKHHDLPSLANISQLFPEREFGFLKTADNRDVYFHAHSVKGEFSSLRAGDRVRFVEEPGDNGPQATVVLPRGHRQKSPSS